MKILFPLLFSIFTSLITVANIRTYVGSTPAHPVVRDFLQISLTDSIDFIRWNLEINSGKFNLRYRYGLAKAGTPGFIDEKSSAFEGQLSRSKNYYFLKHDVKNISFLEVNANLLHFLDGNNRMLIGNGGYSYALNNTQPVVADDINIWAENTDIKSPMVFEGRTPCSDLSTLLGLNKSEACNKMKWYFLFYTDSVTGKPSYFLMGGMGYSKSTMARGRWQIITAQNGHIIYRVQFDKWVRSLDLLKADENVLFFYGRRGAFACRE